MKKIYVPQKHGKHFILLAFLFLSTLLSAQEMIVKGRVYNAETREPLPGVSIVLKGTKTGIATDDIGAYKIEVRQNFYSTYLSDTLLFSYTGFQPQEMAVNGQSSINILLQPMASNIEEVVITGNAVGRSPKNMSYAVGKIDDKMLAQVPSPNIGSGLQGKVPGLRVNQVSGQPGQGTFFQIRSANSIANGQQPLIIVDGIFLNGTLADLNAEDIERVEILKGSAGTSLYGSQAANGVIQIFTKRGKKLNVGETRVIYRGEMGVSQVTNPYNLNNFTNREIIKSEGPQPVLGNVTDSEIFDTELPNLQNYQEDLLFRSGVFQSNYLAVEGKSSQTNFLASLQRFQDEGVIQNSDGYTRNVFRVNADHLIGGKLELQVSTMYSFSEQDLLATNSNGTGSYLANVLFLTPMFDLASVNEEDGSANDWDIDNTGLGTTNPLYDRSSSSQHVNRTRLLGNFTANYYPREWLTVSYGATLDRATNDFEHFLQKGYLSSNIPGFFGPLATSGVQGSAGGGIQRSDRQSSYITSRFNATVQKRFAGFNTAIRGSFLYEDLSYTYNDAIGENLAVAGIRSLDNARSNIFISSEEQEVVGYSGFLIGDADYKNKYIFSSLIRLEGSSLFGAENRWANYYRVSGAYRLTEDVRIKGIQELKLRASVGTSGIRPTFEQRFETFELINGVTTKNTLGNEFLQPALSRETEIGVDMRFFKAFELEFNYSQILTENQILLVPLTGAAGFTGQWRNAGTIDAKVFEAGLNVDFKTIFKIKIPDFTWRVYTTFDRVRQNISKLDVPSYVTGPGIQQSSIFLVEAGKPFGTMIGEVFATNLSQLEGQEGIDPADFIVNEAGYVVRQDQQGTPAERPYKLLDERGNPVIQPIGDINPDFRMGFSHFIGYKGFQIYTLFDWKKGGDIYNMTKQWLYRDQRHGDFASYPDIAGGFFGNDGLYNSQVANNHFVEDGSFFMLREASISYTFERGTIGNFFENLKLSLIGRNVFTFTKYSGFHPDITSAPRAENQLTNRFANATGSDVRTPGGDPSVFMVDAFNYPLARTLTFSLQVTF